MASGRNPLHTPEQNNRVRQHLPEASPFSSVLARLPDLTPPRTKYSTSFGSLNPAPGSTFGFARLQPASTGTAPGGHIDGKSAVSAAFDLLTATPIKSLPAGADGGAGGSTPGLVSPRFDLQLQSPKFPLFQPSPKKPLELRSPPPVRLGESGSVFGGGAMRGHSSPFGGLLDGHSRSAPSPADAAVAAGSAASHHHHHPRSQQEQQRFAELFARAGCALDAAAAAMGSEDIPPPSGGLDAAPGYLSPLRQQGSTAGGPGMPIAAAAARRAHSTGSGNDNGGPEVATKAAATAEQGAGVVDAECAAAELDADMADILGLVARQDENEPATDDAADDVYSVAGSFRKPLPRMRAGSTTATSAAVGHGHQHAAAAGQQQGLFVPSQRPTRRRTLQFGAGAPAAAAADDDEMEPAQLVHSMLPQSPMCQPVARNPQEVDLLLPIPKLRDPSSTSDDGSGSPAHRMRTAPFSLDSPAVQAATHAAVAAALEASTATGGNPTSGAAAGTSAGTGVGIAGSRRPSRAAAAGAAAAARAAAEAAGTPVQRRPSSGLHMAGSMGGDGAVLARTTSTGTLSSVLTPLSHADDGAGVTPQALFAGPKKCNCKKSKCLKLYCDCFANGGFCGPSCSCVNCANKEENSALVQAKREAIKQRNPNAFVQKIEADAALGGQHRRGCNCKKSHCMKKYCECFQAGVPCGEHCKCESCHNTPSHAARRPPGGGASKRARGSSSTAAAQPPQRQPSTRLAAAGVSAVVSSQLRQAQAAAALQRAISQASAGLASAASGISEDVSVDAAAAAAAAAVAAAGASAAGRQQQQSAPQLLHLPLLQPGMLKGPDGTPPLMIPVMLQQAGPSTAAPALAAFAAAAAAATQPVSASGQQQGAGAIPNHATPVAALVGPAAAAAATSAATAGALGTAGGAPVAGSAAAGQLPDSFSFHPASADGSGSSSGHSTPRAAVASGLAAAAVPDFSLDTPGGLATPATAAATAGAEATMLEKLLPAADAGPTAVAATAAVKDRPMPTAPTGVRATPTKRKPARTMTAALM